MGDDLERERISLIRDWSPSDANMTRCATSPPTARSARCTFRTFSSIKPMCVGTLSKFARERDWLSDDNRNLYRAALDEFRGFVTSGVFINA